VSNTDDPDEKPPPQKTVAWDPADVPGLEAEPSGEETAPSAESPPGAAPPESPASVSPPAGTPATSPPPPSTGSAPTQRLPAQGSVPTQRLPVQGDEAAAPAADGATVIFTAEDVAMLQEEQAATTEETDRLIGTLIRDKWRVIKKLGAGSFGTVYKVEDVKGGWIEALKILGVDRLTGAEADEMRARFLREAQIMKRLGKDSKHIVGLSTYEEEIESGLIYFLMEYVEGGSLADALEAEGPFRVDRTIRLALQTCDALMAAHEGPEPVVHRDLKLENLMLAKDRGGEEVVKVLDFGIAKITEREADSRLTTVGTLGTPGYAAPEQLRAEEVDGRTDLFAFGVILYALLTGRDPWLGNLAHESTSQIYELMVATDRAEVLPVSGTGAVVPPAMVSIVMKLLRRDPAQRFQSARELRDALLRVAEGGADAEAASLKVVTDEPGVRVEVREGRNVVAEGPTPCVANGLAPGSYTISVRDPRYEASETTVAVEAGAMQDVTLVATKRDRPARTRSSTRRKSGGTGRWVAVVVLLVAAGATAWARPWGRTLDVDGLVAQASRGMVTSVWLTEGGIEGGIQVAPIPAAANALMPFFATVPENAVTDVVRRLETAGVAVDVSWEVRRLTDLAATAQKANRYFGLEGGDVKSYALRLGELVPDSPEAASLLLKVGERMAWDAEAAVSDGPPELASQLISECLALVPDHPRCLEVSRSM
jgi:protein kinase-like protein/PEGA domain-containing protein